MKVTIAQINTTNGDIESKKIPETENKKAKPFLKWAGGKTQLISEIERCLPADIRKNKFTYIEPFVGSGAILFWMLRTFPNLEKAVINDINSDLTNTYKVISAKPEMLIKILKELQNQYHGLQSDEEFYFRKNYETTRSRYFNSRKTRWNCDAWTFEPRSFQNKRL